MLNMLLWIINFCDQVYVSLKSTVDKHLNHRLRGRVLYYALYSKSEQCYAVLYDYTGFWHRLWLVMFSFIFNNYFETQNVFEFSVVKSNIQNLSHFFIDCAMTSYVDDESKIRHRMLSYKESESMSNTKINEIVRSVHFIFAMVVDVRDNEHDFTSAFSDYKEDIITAESLTISDIITVLSHRLERNVETDGCIVKTMLDNDFVELVLKDNDILLSKIIS